MFFIELTFLLPSIFERKIRKFVGKARRKSLLITLVLNFKFFFKKRCFVGINMCINNSWKSLTSHRMVQKWPNWLSVINFDHQWSNDQFFVNLWSIFQIMIFSVSAMTFVMIESKGPMKRIGNKIITSVCTRKQSSLWISGQNDITYPHSDL